MPANVKSIEDCLERAAHANAVIDAIAAHGRRFFFYEPEGRVGRFAVEPDGKIVWFDEYTRKRINPFSTREWPGFHHGGTLRAIVEDLAVYINTGAAMNGGRFGPWPNSRMCPWGYGFDAMEAVRAALAGSPAIEHAVPPAS